MAKGDGSITKLGSNKYRVQISYGKDPITGRYQRATKVVNGTKAEARKVRDQMRKEREDGLILDGSKLTFGAFSKVFLDSLETSGAAVGTIRARRSNLKCVCMYIGDMKLKDITPQTIETALAAIKRDKVEKRGSFSNTTLLSYYSSISSVMQKALDYDFVPRNPCDGVKAPPRNSVERNSLDARGASSFLRLIDAKEEEAIARIEEVEANRISRGRDVLGRSRIFPLSTYSYVIAVRIGLATGMRRGEVLGLLWDSVNLDSSILNVRRSNSAADGLKDPKTRAGVRHVSIDGKTNACLKRWKGIQKAELLKIGIKQDESTPVCCSSYGDLIYPEDFAKWFRRLCDRNGFQGLKFHELRHTQATLLLGNGTDVKTVQTRLGHANASITLNTYAHALPENDKKAANLMANLLEESKPAPVFLKINTA